MNTAQSWRTPDEEARALRRAAALASCRVGSVSARLTSAGPRACGTVDCPDGWAAARMLLAASADDARTAGARDLALELRAGSPSDEQFARAVHDFVKSRVRFVREAGEVFTSPSYTLAVGAGDCDDHARLAYALLRAGGLPARLAFLFNPGAAGPSHVVAQAGVDGRWRWLETTVDAAFDEHPYEAGRRLGLLRARTDLTSGVRTMNESDLPPIPPGFDPGSVDRDVAALEILGYLPSTTCDVGATDPRFRCALARFQQSARVSVDGLIGPETRGAIARTLPADEFGLGYLADLAPPEPRLTKHLSPAFFRGVEDMARRFNVAGSSVKGEQFLAVWLAESGLRNIQNRQGYPAYGLNQLFNAPEKGLPGFRNVGWSGTAEEYLALTPEQQLPYLERYYLLATGGNLAVLRDAASLYLVNFMPAYAAHADEPSFVLARKHPDDDGSEDWRKAHPGSVYAANRSLDREGKGFIVVGDLKNAISAAQRGSGDYWLEVRSRYYRETEDRGDGGGEGVADIGKTIASVAILISSASVAAWIVASG